MIPIDLPIFIDTNIFLSYATDFEKNHDKSECLFHGKYDRHTGIRVKMELDNIKKRRTKIYKDLLQFYKQNSCISNFKPSVKLKKNDEIHLKELLNHLKTIKKSEVLRCIRTIGRIIDQGVRHALSLVASPLIPFSRDLLCEKQMEMCIRNQNDAKIFVDALCWAEDNSPAIFCTQDYSDIVSKREAIYQKVRQIRAYDPEELPLKIVSLNELFE